MTRRARTTGIRDRPGEVVFKGEVNLVWAAPPLGSDMIFGKHTPRMPHGSGKQYYLADTSLAPMHRIHSFFIFPTSGPSSDAPISPVASHRHS
jgi:hypothetical protein